MNNLDKLKREYKAYQMMVQGMGACNPLLGDTVIKLQKARQAYLTAKENK